MEPGTQWLEAQPAATELGAHPLLITVPCRTDGTPQKITHFANFLEVETGVFKLDWYN